MKRKGDDANFDTSIYGLINFSSLCNNTTCMDETEKYETEYLYITAWFLLFQHLVML